MGFFGDLLGGVASGFGSLMGFIPGVPDWISGVTNVLGGSAGSAMSSESQRQENQLQRDWQSQENEKSRVFNAEQAQLNRDFELDMWNKQNEYNTPANIVKRMMAAGVNPAAAFRQGAGATGISQNLPSGSMASSSPVSASFPFSGTQASMEALSVRGAYLKSLTGAIKDLSGAGVDKANVEKIWQEISSMVSEQKLTELKAEAQDLANQVYALTGKKRAMAEVNNLISDLYVKSANIAYIEAKTYNEKLQQFEIYWRGFEAKFKALLGEKDYEKAKIVLKWLEPQLKANLRNTEADTREKNSRSELNAATASLHAELAKTEYTFRPIREYLLNDEHNLNVRTIDSKVKEWQSKANEAEQKAFLEALKAQDLKSYNSFQRVLLGKGSIDDKQNVIELLRGLSDADRLSGAAPVYK